MNQRRFLIVCLLAVVTVFLNGSAAVCQVETLADRQPEQSDTVATVSTVSLVIDFGDGFETHYSRLPCDEDQTVLKVMQQAKSHPHPLKFEQRGRGETAFLESISGVKNEGGSGANWIFYVNGERADRGFGVKTVAPADTILWKFEN